MQSSGRGRQHLHPRLWCATSIELPTCLLPPTAAGPKLPCLCSNTALVVTHTSNALSGQCGEEKQKELHLNQWLSTGYRDKSPYWVAIRCADTKSYDCLAPFPLQLSCRRLLRPGCQPGDAKGAIGGGEELCLLEFRHDGHDRVGKLLFFCGYENNFQTSFLSSQWSASRLAYSLEAVTIIVWSQVHWPACGCREP